MYLYLSEVWKKAINNEQTVGVILIDCSKAFDSIDHQILEQKIKGIGITGQLYDLIESYLEDRQQCTEVNGTSSELKETRHGVPQSSLLGLRLFSLFMNDILESISAGEVHLYADDITAFVTGATTDKTPYKMQVVAKEVTQWCRRNKMTVNIKKTEAMIIQSKKFIGPLLPVEIADTVVDYKEECKLLGVFVDRQLK